MLYIILMQSSQLLMTYCLFVLYYGSDVMQKQIWERSSFKFKMSSKAAKTIFSINIPFVLEIAMKEDIGIGQEVFFFLKRLEP